MQCCFLGAARRTPAVHYERTIGLDSVDLAAQRSVVISMPSGIYKCCRCARRLRPGKRREPRRCSNHCGEWLTLGAVDEHLFPAILRPFGRAPRRDAPCCARCGKRMQAPLCEPFHLCPRHGVWFDDNDRRSFSRVLSAEIAKHRASRTQLFTRPWPRSRRRTWVRYVRFVRNRIFARAHANDADQESNTRVHQD